MAATMALQSAGTALYEQIAGGMSGAFGSLNAQEISAADAGIILQNWALLAGRAGLPIMGTILAVSVAVGLLQGRFTFSLKPITPELNKINPLTGLKRLFSLNSLVEQLKALAKLAVIGLIGYREVANVIPQFPNLMGQTPAAGITFVATRSVAALRTMGFGLIGIGIIDYAYQFWQFEKSLRMTKEEVKQELKQQEGLPEVKQKQRQRAREMALRRKAIKEVPTADVVVTNPTHYAVALRYKPEEDFAPRVVAKGADLLALRIKALAKKHDVPTVENRPLAQTLYKSVSIGKTVPPELYQAVAEVLAFVYSLRRQRRR